MHYHWLYSNEQCHFVGQTLQNDKICIVTDGPNEETAGEKEHPTKLQHLKNIISKGKDNSDFKH